MIILDTNVVSEMMRLGSDEAVVAWLDRQDETAVWITSVTVFEVRVGIEVLPPGRRRTALTADFDEFVDAFIQHRVVAFDARAAHAAAGLTADRRRAGRPGEMRDTMIAGIAVATGASLATRDTRHFADVPATVIDPWTA